MRVMVVGGGGGGGENERGLFRLPPATDPDLVPTVTTVTTGRASLVTTVSSKTPVPGHYCHWQEISQRIVGSKQQPSMERPVNQKWKLKDESSEDYVLVDFVSDGWNARHDGNNWPWTAVLSKHLLLWRGKALSFHGHQGWSTVGWETLTQPQL